MNEKTLTLHILLPLTSEIRPKAFPLLQYFTDKLMQPLHTLEVGDPILQDPTPLGYMQS